MMSAPVDPRFALDSANQSDLVQKKLSIDAMRKRVSGGPDEESKLREACEGFESVFLQKMWEQMRKNVKKEGYLHSKDEESYQSMFDVELAKKMASAGGIGLADMLYEQLGQKLHNASKTTGTGGMRAPLPIDPAGPARKEAAPAAAAVPPMGDLYSEIPEEAPAPPAPVKSQLDKALEELAASRNPAEDPANATYPMFDLENGAPMNQVAEKMKAESQPRREFDVNPLPERISAPGKARPSNALRGVSRSARHARKAKGAEEAAQTGQGTQTASQPAGMQTAQTPQGIQAARNIQAAQTIQAAQSAQGAGQAAPAMNAQAPGQSLDQTLEQTHSGREANPAAGQHYGMGPVSAANAPAAPPAAGRSLWPVRGDVVSAYGRTENGWNTGVSLAAGPESPVVAPMAGTVAFVGEKDGMPQMVLDHGDGLTSLYTNVTSTLAPGDAVQAGTEFARVSAVAGSPASRNAGAAGNVQFEVRRGELAINPETILG